MKMLLPFITLLFLSFTICNGQEAPIKYINNETAYWNKKEIFDNTESINEIILNTDATFEFHSFPDSSCFSWRDFKGTWERKKDTIFFYDQYVVNEKDIRCSFQKEKKRREYVLNFRTDKNSKLKNKSILVEYVYDFDADLEDIEQTMTINNDNQIIIPFKNVPKRNKLASIQIVYHINSSEKRYGLISETNYVNKREKPLPNIIDVVIVEEPLEQTIYRTTKGVFKNDMLQIVSKSKTQTTLPDFTGEIHFEEFYTKKSTE